MRGPVPGLRRGRNVILSATTAAARVADRFTAGGRS